MVVFDVNLLVLFVIGKQLFCYVGIFYGQYIGNMFYYIDDLMIGSCYIVCGFDGEMMFVVVCGFYWCNELQVLIGQMGQVVYVGFDYGCVWGLQFVVFVGMQLVGVVIGIKGSVGM